MSTISNYPSGINELVLRGVPTVIPNPGKSFWVSNADVLLDDGNSVAGADQAGGGTYQRPFRTIDFAIGQCTANRGDVIYVMPGHVETVTTDAGIDIDVAGVSIIGLGRGLLQPRVNYTALQGNTSVDASNCTIYNINFHANVTSITFAIDVEVDATDTLIKNCFFDVETTGTDEFNIPINIRDGCDRTIVENNIIDMGLASSIAAVRFVGLSDSCLVRNNRITGDYSEANVSAVTALSTNIFVEDNLLVQGTTDNLNATEVIAMITGTTGIIRNNDFVCDVATFALQTIADTMVFINNQRTDDIDAAKTSTTISTSVTVSADG